MTLAIEKDAAAVLEACPEKNESQPLFVILSS